MTQAFSKITEYEGITEYRLESNGLKVLLSPRRASGGLYGRLPRRLAQ